MIVDCHTQVWAPGTEAVRITGLPAARLPRADTAHHLRAIDPVDRAIVLAFKSRYLNAEIPNHFVADYVRQHATKMVGFAGIDPTDVDWPAQLRLAHEELHLKGVAISPALQNFHPADTRAMRLYAACLERGLPILFDHSLRNPAAKMEFARPLLLDEVAREFPDLRLIVSHLGYPWVEETVVLLAKHRNVYADIAGIQQHTWLAYNALLSAYEYGVMDKLLFGSGFPYRLPAECIEALYSINQLSHGTSLKTIPREQLRGIVERDSLSLLGIEAPSGPSSRPRTGIFTNDD